MQKNATMKTATKSQLVDLINQLKLNNEILEHNAQLERKPANPALKTPDNEALFWQQFNKQETTRQASKTTQLNETFYGSLGFESIVSPWEQFMNGQNLVFPLWAGRYDNRLINYWISESQLDLIRMYSRWLYDFNKTAKGVVRSMENYIIKTGYSYIATSKSGKGNVEALQTWIDSFLEKNNWYERELDWFRRSRRDGEWFARIYPQDDGIPEIRCVEPEQIRAKDDTPEWFFGVKVPGHDKDNLKGYDFEKPIAYWVTWDGAIENGEEVDADEMVMMKLNTDICIRRGLSDFFLPVR
jgi:hypothetical protein